MVKLGERDGREGGDKKGKREVVSLQMVKGMSSEMSDPILSSALNKITKIWENLQMK